MPTTNAAPNTLGDVIGRCQSLMGDPQGRFISRAYIVPFINQGYEDIAAQIKNASGKNLEAVVEAIDVTAGTTDLYSLQNMGDPTANPPTKPGPFAGLFNPIRMWTKLTGTLPQYYTEAAGPRDTLPHINPPGTTSASYVSKVTFAWIGNKLQITPVAAAIDIQLYGRFEVPPLVSDTDQLLLYTSMTAALTYTALALVGVERSNPAMVEGYIERATATIDNIVADIIRQCQREPRRVAKMGGRGGTYWGWGSSLT